MPTVLLCTTTVGPEARAFDEAARRLGITLRLVVEPGVEAGARLGTTLQARFDRDPAAVEPVLSALAGAPVDGVVAAGDRPAWLAAHVAQARGVPWHGPDAVASATHRLLARGRWLAAGLPVPWFVSIPATGDDDLERLSRVRFPALIAPVDLPCGDGAVRVGSADELMAARTRLATGLARSGRAASASADTLIVEGVADGQAFALDGVLEAGALRVFALCAQVAASDDGDRATILVTPAPLARARQQVIAGHVARAALALGLHHGPVHAEGVDDGEAVIVTAVVPRPIDGRRAGVVPVIAPDGSRCGLEDVLLAHAVGRPLDGYGHEAVARGVLRAPVTPIVSVGDGPCLSEIRGLPGVTAVDTAADPSMGLAGAGQGETRAVLVFAESGQPDDVIAVLRAVQRVLRAGQARVSPTPTA